MYYENDSNHPFGDSLTSDSSDDDLDVNAAFCKTSNEQSKESARLASMYFGSIVPPERFESAKVEDTSSGVSDSATPDLNDELDPSVQIYEIETHGPPLAAIMLVKKEDPNAPQIEYCYPNDLLDLSRTLPKKELRFKALEKNFIGKRNVELELASALHLIPDLALGPMKRDALVDLVYFVLPTSEGRVFYGISYVAKFDQETGKLAKLESPKKKKCVPPPKFSPVPSRGPGYSRTHVHDVAKTLRSQPSTLEENQVTKTAAPLDNFDPVVQKDEARSGSGSGSAPNSSASSGSASPRQRPLYGSTDEKKKLDFGAEIKEPISEKEALKKMAGEVMDQIRSSFDFGLDFDDFSADSDSNASASTNNKSTLHPLTNYKATKQGRPSASIGEAKPSKSHPSLLSHLKTSFDFSSFSPALGDGHGHGGSSTCSPTASNARQQDDTNAEQPKKKREESKSLLHCALDKYEAARDKRINDKAAKAAGPMAQALQEAKKRTLAENARAASISLKGAGRSSDTGAFAHYVEPVPDKPKKYTTVAIVLLSKVPLYGYLACRLEYLAQAYFATGKLKEHALLKSFVDQFNLKALPSDWNYEHLLVYLEPYFKPVTLCVSQRITLFIIKALMAGKKICFFAQSAGRVSTAILSFLSLIPGSLCLGFNCSGFGPMWHSWSKFGLPLRLFHSKNILLPYMTVDLAPLLKEAEGYLVGLCDARVLHAIENKPDVLLDLEEDMLQLRSKDLLCLYSLSLHEVAYFEDFFDCLDDNAEEMDTEDEIIQTIIDTGGQAFTTIGNYLGKAPTTMINLGGKIKKALTGKKRGGLTRKPKESPLKLLDMHYPGFVPPWLMKYSIANLQAKDVIDEKLDIPLANADAAGGKANGTVSANNDDETQVATYDSEVFTFAQAFSTMYSHAVETGNRCYRYCGYIECLVNTPNEPDRDKEIEYAVNNRVQPMQEYLLKFFTDVALVGGKSRSIYNLVMDFEFDMQAMSDQSHPVTGYVALLDDKWCRGALLRAGEEHDEDGRSDDDDDDDDYLGSLVRGVMHHVTGSGTEAKSSTLSAAPGSKAKGALKKPAPNYVEKSYEIASALAAKIVEVQDKHGIEFLEMWIQTPGARLFYRKNALEKFNDPTFINQNNFAKYEYPNGDVYTGELVDLLREGHGCYVSTDGSSYKGQWFRDKRHGLGTLVSTKYKYKYTGGWKINRKHGHGSLETEEYRYTGTFKHDKMHGTGKLENKNGFVYEGDFQDGKFNGRGKIVLPDGTTKMGTFRDNQLVGVCSVVALDGTIYVGEFHGDVMHGNGTLRFNPTAKFEGIWVKGKRNGQGVLTLTSNDGRDSVVVESIWANDEMNMQDVLVTYSNGYKYSGSLCNFKEMFDFGVINVDPSDERLRKFTQLFATIENRLLPHGNGTCRRPNGSTFSGDFICGMRFGNGKMVFGNALIYNGKWEFGKPCNSGTLACLGLNCESMPIVFDRDQNITTTLDPNIKRMVLEALHEIKDETIETNFIKPNLDPNSQRVRK